MLGKEPQFYRLLPCHFGVRCTLLAINIEPNCQTAKRKRSGFYRKLPRVIRVKSAPKTCVYCFTISGAEDAAPADLNFNFKTI